jgi:hypothetical protein
MTLTTLPCATALACDKVVEMDSSSRKSVAEKQAEYQGAIQPYSFESAVDFGSRATLDECDASFMHIIPELSVNG